MSTTKYNFDKILKEYNEQYNCNYESPPKATNIIITHTTTTNVFCVTYEEKGGIRENKKSLKNFLYQHVSCDISASRMRSIILSKEEEKLNLKIEIWPPSKIRYAYLYSNYFLVDIGNLGKSCMRKKDMQKALNFYVKNEVRIVVVIDSNNRIHARALLWDNIESTKRKTSFGYLDRVYARTDTLCPLFYDLAGENKWKRYPTTAVNQMNKSYYKKGIIIEDMCHLPYMDTFRYLYPKDNLLTSSNTLGIHRKSDSYVALHEHTNRGYYPALDPDRVAEACTGNFISKKDAVFVKRYDGYVLKASIVDINGAYYSKYDRENIMQTMLDGYIFKKDLVNEIITNDTMNKLAGVHSAKYDGYIHKSNIIIIGDKVYHKKDTNLVCFDDKWYHISQCFVNYDRKDYNDELAKQPIFFYSDLPETWIPNAAITRKGNLIPKERAIIAYNLVCVGMSREECAESFAQSNPKFDKDKFLKTCNKDIIRHQEVYCTNMDNLIQLTTGELIVNSVKNRKYLKKFNNKWYIKQDFRLPNKKQLLFSFMEKL